MPGVGCLKELNRTFILVFIQIKRAQVDVSGQVVGSIFRTRDSSAMPLARFPDRI